MILGIEKNQTLKFMLMVQIILMIWISVCLFILKPLYAWLLPILILQLFIYFFVFSKVHRIIHFLLILLPFSGIGFLPGFYREVFLQGGVLFLIVLYITGQFLLDEKDKIALPLDFPMIPFTLLLLTSLISMAFNIVRGLSSKDLFRFTFLLWQFLAILYILPAVLRKKKVILQATYIAIASLVAACLCLTFLIVSRIVKGKSFSLGFILLNLNVVALMIEPFIPLAIGLSLGLTKKSKKWLLYLCILIILSTLLITQSIGAYLGTLIGIFYVIFRSKSYKWAIRFAALLSPIFLIGVFREIFVTRLGQTSLLELTILQRFKLWLTAFSVIKENFLLGIGLANFRLIKFQYGFPLWIDPAKRFNTHNLYLELFVGLGIFGLIFFVALFVSLIKNSNKIKDGMMRNIGYGLCGGIVAYGIHSLFDCSLWFPPAFFVLAIFGGLLSAMINCDKNQTPS